MFFDHLDAGAAVLGNLMDVGALQVMGASSGRRFLGPRVEPGGKAATKKARLAERAFTFRFGCGGRI